MPSEEDLHHYAAAHDYLDDEGVDDGPKFGTKQYYYKHLYEYDGINHYHDAVEHAELVDAHDQLRAAYDNLKSIVDEYNAALDEANRDDSVSLDRYFAASDALRAASDRV